MNDNLETVEEASWKYNPLKKLDGEFIRAAFINGAKWQEESKQKYPLIVVRNDDKEEFIHLRNGIYRTKWGILNSSISEIPFKSFDETKFKFYYE